MLEIFGYEFMQRALVTGLIAGILLSVVSFFVILRRMSFFGVGMSHVAFGGIGLGLYWGINPLVAGGIFSVLVSFILGFLSREGELKEDAAMGVLFSLSMALGVLVISIKNLGYVDIFSFLFGSLLAITGTDLVVLSIVALGIGAFFLLWFGPLFFASFDEEACWASGFNTGALNYGLILAIGLAVVVSAKIVGTVLASALIVMPGATGYELARNYRSMLYISLASGVGCVLGGLILSYYLDIPSGSAIVLLSGVTFALALLFSPRRGFLRRVAAWGAKLFSGWLRQDEMAR